MKKQQFFTIWEDKYQEPIEKIRVGCRGIIIDDGKILLSYESKKDWYFISGGGLEVGETLEEGCRREVAEETGYLVEPLRLLVTADGYYHNMIFRNHFFLCRVIGQTERCLTAEEAENKLLPRWVPVEEAIRIFAKYSDYEQEFDALCESYYRDYRILKDIVAPLLADERV